MSEARRTLLAPRMVLLHVLVLAVVLVLARLGVWQLARHGEAVERSQARALNEAAGLDEVSRILAGVDLDDTGAIAAAEWRTATATGTYRPEDEVLQRGRSSGGRTGFDVLTPLDLEDGRTLLVRRGWVPFDNDLRPPVPDALPPTGPVQVIGALERSVPQPTSGIAQRDPDEGELDIVFNADLGRLGPQLGGDVLPMILRLDQQLPDQPGELPLAQPLPPADNGPHLNYAIQWFSFALIAAGMYALWLRRRVRGDERAVSAAVSRP